MLRRLPLIAAIGAASLLLCLRPANAQAIFDSLSPTSYTYTGSTPRHAIGQVLNLGNLASTTTPLTITGSSFGLVSTAAQSFSNVTVTQYFWGTASNAVSGTTLAYSNLLASRTITLGAQTFTANGVVIYTVNYTTPFSLAGLTTAGVLGYSEVVQVDSGSGLAGNDSVVPVLATYASNQATVGSSAFNTSATASNFYRNASGRTDGNFLGSDARTLNANHFIALRLNAAVVPETNTLAMLAMGIAPIAGVVIARRRKRS